MSPTAQALDLIARREDDFASVLAAIYMRRHTGTVLVHFLNGQPRKVEFPGVQIDLVEGDLDKLIKVIDPS